MRDRCRAALVDLDKSATPVRPAKDQRRWTAVALRIGQLLIDRLSVAMNDAGIARKQCRAMLAAAAGRIDIDNGRGIQPAPGSIIPRDRPEVAGLGSAPPGIEHRRGVSSTTIFAEAS